MAIVIDKDNDSIKIVTDGVTKVVTIRKEDTVVSIPPAGCRKIYNFYYRPADEAWIIDVAEE